MTEVLLYDCHSCTTSCSVTPDLVGLNVVSPNCTQEFTKPPQDSAADLQLPDVIPFFKSGKLEILKNHLNKLILDGEIKKSDEIDLTRAALMLGLKEKCFIELTKMILSKAFAILLLFFQFINAYAQPIAKLGTESLPVFSGNPNREVVATFLGHTAAYSNNLYLERLDSGMPGLDGDQSNDRYIFNNHRATPLQKVFLGRYPLGTELVFRLHVNNTGKDFYSGSTNRNIDLLAHARVQADWQPGVLLISFEDLLGTPEFPNGFNDLSFYLENASVSRPNMPPTLNELLDMLVLKLRSDQDNIVYQKNLYGISSGAVEETQVLTVTAISDNPKLIPNPVVNYNSPRAVGSLAFKPVAGMTGKATITVTVKDDGGVLNGGQDTFSRQFTVTVSPINRAPTLNALADVKLLQNAPSQTVNLSGIGSGAVDEVQVLTVTATSDNPALIANPKVTYTNPNAVGTLSYQPAVGATGKATITVMVKDDGGVLNGGQDTFSRQFTVTVSPINPCLDLNLTNGLVAYYPFNGNAKDESGSSEPPNAGEPSNHKFDGNLTFTDVHGTLAFASSWMEKPSWAVPDNELEFTFSFWFNQTNYPAAGLFSWSIDNHSFGRGFGPEGFRIYSLRNQINDTTAVNKIRFGVGNEWEINKLLPNQEWSWIETELSDQQQGWHHIVAAYSAKGVQTLYVDGVLVGRMVGVKLSRIDNADGNNLTLSGRGGVQISEVRYYSKALTDCEVTALHELETVSPINRAPTLNALADVNLLQNAQSQTVSLSGISSGAVDEVQGLTVTANSDNPELIADPSVTYTSPNATGTLIYKSVAGVTGKATITVTVRDDGGVLNGGQDTFRRQFTVTVSPLNRPPTLNALADVKLLQNGPSQTVNLSGIGSGAVEEVQALTVTATSDNPGLIPNPTLTYTSPNAVGKLIYQPIAGATGKATITVTVKDDGGVLNGGQDTFSRQFLVDVTRVDNKAPEVQIVSPQDGSITTVDGPISLVAEANDSDGTISKVEFFQNNNQLIGTAASNPYQVTVNNLSEGKYTFYAKATDNSGLSSVSTPVSISVLGERRDVAVIKVSLDPKLDILTQYISEVQLSGQQESLTWKTFERSDISFEVLARYRVVVWNDPHPASKISKNEIGLLKRLLQSGVTVYSIGPKLATAADGLDAADKTDWRSIVNLNAIGKAAEMGQVELIGEEDHGPILDGMYGTVEAFKTSGTVDGGTATASADSSGKSAGCDVYVSFPSVSLPDSALARRFSQLIPLAENGDEFSIEERKKVFKNAICWLLDCNRCAVINLTLLTEETLIEPAVPQTGEQFVLKLQFTQNAECPATGVRVKVEVPPGLTVLGATTEQGEVSHGATEANFSLGRLGVHKVVPVELKLRSQIGGIVTNNITFYANGLTSTSIVAFHHETAFTISGDSVPMISADRDVTGNVRLKVGGQLGATYVIEKSVAIAGNGQIQWAALKEFQLVASEYVHVHVIDATTSSAMFRVRKK